MAGNSQHGKILHFGPTGQNLGLSADWAAGSNVAPPDFLGTDPLNNVLYSYTQRGYFSPVTGYAEKGTLSGTTVKDVHEYWTFFFPYSDVFSVGRMAGDSAGRLLIGANLCGVPNCNGATGYNFGQGLETGHLILRYGAAGDYLGSIPSPGNWRASAAGELYVANSFQGSIDVGCGAVTGGPGTSTVFAKLGFDGHCIWSKAFNAPTPSAFVVGADQNVYLAFTHTGSIDLGGGPSPDGGAGNLTIATFDPAGNPLLSKTFGGAGAVFSGVTLDANASGIVALTGTFSGAVDLGAGLLSTAAGNTFLAAFDPTGALRWSRVVVKAYASGLFSMALQACFMVIATNESSVDLGAGPLVPAPPMWPDAPSIGIAALAL